MTTINLKAVLSTIAILTLLFLTIMTPQSAESATAIKEPNSIGLEIQSPSGLTTYNSSIPVDLKMELLYGMATNQYCTGISNRDITCKYSLDNGEWIDVPFTGMTVNRTQWDINYPFVNIIDCTYKTTLQGLSAGTHSINFTTYPYPLHYFVLGGGHPQIGSPQIIFNVYSNLNITVFSPENQTYHTNNLQLSFIINQDTPWVVYTLDNQANQTTSGNMTLNGLTEGSHSLTLYANDATGNTGTSNTIYFDIQLPEPFPILTVVAGVSVALIIIAGALIYLKRRKH